MGCSAGPSVTSAPALYLDAVNSKSYPGSGTTWTDLSGNGRNGTLVWGPTFDSANGGQIVLDGIGDHIVLNNCLPLKWQNITAVSFDVIFKTLGNPNFNRQYIFDSRKTDGVSYYAWYLLLIDGSSSWLTGVGNSASAPYSDFAFSTSSPATGPIWHMTLTIDKQTITNNFKLYVNGTINTTKSFDFTINQGSDPNQEMYLGGYFGNLGNDSNYKLKGSYYMARVYKNTVLSADQVRQNFNAMRGRYGL